MFFYSVAKDIKFLLTPFLNISTDWLSLFHMFFDVATNIFEFSNVHMVNSFHFVTQNIYFLLDSIKFR